MDEFAESLERELKSAVEVKDKDSLHRYIRLLVDGTVGRETYEDGFTRLNSGIDGLKTDVKIIAERIEKMQHQMDRRFGEVDRRFESMQQQMDRRFEQVDKRFEQVDKRFEEMHGRFRMMFAFMTVGFSVLALLMTLFKFLQ